MVIDSPIQANCLNWFGYQATSHSCGGAANVTRSLVMVDNNWLLGCACSLAAS